MVRPAYLDIMAAWGPDTCHKPGQYTEGNRARGQCCPTALCVQAAYGGDVMTCFVGRERHYYNVLPDGTEIDLTLSQYGYPAERRDARKARRSQLRAHEDVRRRYEILWARATGIATARAALSPTAGR